MGKSKDLAELAGVTSRLDTLGASSGSLSNRNLIANGSCIIAQRGASSTTNGYGSVDRFQTLYSGTDEAPTQAQVDVASGTTPYTLGFRKALRITNGNQTSGAGAADYLGTFYRIEGQDINSSGWNTTDPNSKLTLSYWVKSSVAQTFYGRFRAFASDQYEYTYSFALSANTWTKVTKTIPGNSNFSSLVNTNAIGFFHVWQCFWGTDYTNNKTLDAWAVKDNANKSPDMTSTWYTTNDATFEITGCQLEVGSQSTDFEWEPTGITLAKCERYFQTYSKRNWQGTNEHAANYYMYCDGVFRQKMRAAPTATFVGTITIGRPQVGVTQRPNEISGLSSQGFLGFKWPTSGTYGGQLGTHGDSYYRMYVGDGPTNRLDFDAEL